MIIGLPFLSFRVTVTSVYHPNASEIYLELPFTANLKDLLTFYSNILTVARFMLSNSLFWSKKESEMVKSFILAFKYYKNENHSSFFDLSFPLGRAFWDRHILRIASESFDNSLSYISS